MDDREKTDDFKVSGVCESSVHSSRGFGSHCLTLAVADGGEGWGHKSSNGVEKGFIMLTSEWPRQAYQTK